MPATTLESSPFLGSLPEQPGIATPQQIARAVQGLDRRAGSGAWRRRSCL